MYIYMQLRECSDDTTTCKQLKRLIVVNLPYVDIKCLLIKGDNDEEDHFVLPNETLTTVVAKG